MDFYPSGGSVQPGCVFGIDARPFGKQYSDIDKQTDEETDRQKNVQTYRGKTMRWAESRLKGWIHGQTQGQTDSQKNIYEFCTNQTD